MERQKREVTVEKVKTCYKFGEPTAKAIQGCFLCESILEPTLPFDKEPNMKPNKLAKWTNFSLCLQTPFELLKRITKHTTYVASVPGQHRRL